MLTYAEADLPEGSVLETAFNHARQTFEDAVKKVGPQGLDFENVVLGLKRIAAAPELDNKQAAHTIALGLLYAACELSFQARLDITRLAYVLHDTAEAGDSSSRNEVIHNFDLINNFSGCTIEQQTVAAAMVSQWADKFSSGERSSVQRFAFRSLEQKAKSLEKTPVAPTILAEMKQAVQKLGDAAYPKVN